jgi:tetratricopeptide (TPR) repeat protein
MSKPTVFISYSHQDKDLLAPLIAQLKSLEQAGLLEVWADTRIDAGAKWYPEIEEAMKRAAVAVCLVSEHFLSSDFCTKQEVPFLLKREADEGLLIVPVLLSDCVWEAHRWLKETQMLPGEGQSVRTHYAQNPAAVFSRAAKRIYDKVNDPAYQAPVPEPTWQPLAGDCLDLTRLPETGAALFGRDDELELMDQAWASAKGVPATPTRILAFTAHGGVGKSTLVNHWLAEMARDNYRGATRVFGWSFFSQGVREENVASADSFIDAALRFFGDSDPTAGSPWDKGARLAHLVGQQRALLVLDGMEPLQSPNEFERGKLRDPALESLLRRLARESNGLCLITTREPVPDLAGRSGVVTRDLEQIDVAAGRALLRTARVVGSDNELEALADRFGPHALSITLLGVYLYEQPGHGIGPAKILEQLPGEKPIDKVLAGFEQWLGESPEREALRLLGFFDRPADDGCLGALRATPAIPGLTDHLSNLDEAGWHHVLDRLEKLRLLQVERSKSGKYAIDAHPLIREHFAQILKNADAWREGHRRLYEHLCATTQEGDEPTLEDLQPLYQAVAHGCHAGLLQEAAEKIYHVRISKREKAYPTKTLGAFGSDLGAVACFFDEPWNRVSPALTEAYEAWLLSQAAFRLRSVGRLTEAVEPMRKAIESVAKQHDWLNAARGASNLSELELTLGEVAGALRDAEQCLEYAKRVGKWGSIVIRLARLADTLHQSGRRSEAETRFREAEEMQAENMSRQPMLSSWQGFAYCEQLLGAPERAAWQIVLKLKTQKPELGTAAASCRGVSQRVAQLLKWEEGMRGAPIIHLALYHLTLGRTELYVQILKSSAPQLLTSDFSHMNAAVNGLRRAGQQQYLPLGLLTRAWLRFLTGAHTGSESAQEDLDEAWEIAERGPMRLLMADIHLYRARLFGRMRDEGGGMKYPWDKNPDGSPRGPKDDLEAAEKLINECGYHRRDEELADAKLAILGTT